MTERPTPYIVTSSAPDDIRATANALGDALVGALDAAFAEIAALRAEVEVLKATPARDPWKTRREAAEYLRCSPSTIDDMAASGRLPKYRLGPQTPLYRVEDLDAVLSPVNHEEAA